MARLLADANFPRPAVFKLRRLGHDVIRVQEMEGSSRPANPMEDSEVLDVAFLLRRTVLTHNRRHFERLHRERPDHKGIVLCKHIPNQDFKRLAKDIDEFLKSETKLAGKLMYVDINSAEDDEGESVQG